MVEKPKTCVVTIRVDLRDAAQFYSLFDTLDVVTIRSLSHLFSEGFSMLSDLIDQKYTIPKPSTAEALDLLTKRGLMGDIKNSRNRKTILDQLALEDGGADELSQARVAKPLITQQDTLQEEIAKRAKEFQVEQNSLKSVVPNSIIKEED